MDTPELFSKIDAQGGFWPLRLALARASAALVTDPARAAALAVTLDSSPLGLPGLAPLSRLSAGALSGHLKSSKAVDAFLAYALAERSEVLSREALGDAAHLARTSSEKRAVREAWEAHIDPSGQGPRARIARAVALARVAESPAHARALLASCAAHDPTAPEIASDLFDEIDRKAFDEVVKNGSTAIRIARARALAGRDPLAARALVADLPPTPENRLAAAEISLAIGEAGETVRHLTRPSRLVFEDGGASRHVEALLTSARLRLVGREEAGHTRGHARKKRSRPAARRAGVLSDKERREADERLVALEPLLALPLAEADRRRLLGDGIRVALKLSRHDVARRLADALVLVDPSTTAGGEDFFSEAFGAFREGRLGEAVRLWQEQAALYRDIAIRRRAIYWEARARSRAGELDQARGLYASLLPGTSPDVYARWSAAALGVALPLLPPRPAPDRDDDDKEPRGDAPGAVSRELLACGFPDLAEDAAESEGPFDPVFAALAAGERGDYRRAASLLKQRYPELGTPEEGSVPLAARRAFYPLAHVGVVESVAASGGLAPSLLFGLIRQESVFTPSIRSRAGAVGLMQVMPATGRSLLRRESRRARPDLLDPGQNVRLGAVYLSQLLAKFDGDTASALAAYNAGPARVRRWKRERPDLPADEFLESIPFAEPRAYVKKVLFFQGAYAALWGVPLEPAPVEPFHAAAP